MAAASPREGELQELVRRGSVGLKYVVTDTIIYRGLASTIFLGVERGTLLQVGIKVIMKELLDTSQELAQALSEVRIHSSIPPHANVIQLLSAEETPSAILLVTPYTPCGDLWELTKYGQTYCESEVRNCAAQILASLRHIHTCCNLIHGDIKPHNFLLFKVADKYAVQLCDFGLAEHPDCPGGTITFRGLRGTSGWFAPEMLEQKNYSQAVDLFSTGLILFRMLAGYPPFDPPSRMRAPAEFDDRYWCHISSNCRHFVGQLLSLDPLERKSAADCCEHEWLSGPPPPKPSDEQIKVLCRYGPPPNTSVLFWPPVEFPRSVNSNSYANLRDIAGEEDDNDSIT